MPTDLLNIGRTGAAAARAGLELTAQNIANAANPDYTRRTISQSELVATAVIAGDYGERLGGVRVGAIQRADAELLQLQLRESTSDLARTQAELAGLQGAEGALEQSGLFERLTDFEATLVRLESDPLDPTLRTATLESARQLAATFQLADASLVNASEFVTAEVTAGVDATNGLADQLARINVDLAGTEEGSYARAALLDQRDAALRDLSEQFDIETRFEASGAVEVTLSGSSGPPLVERAVVNALSVATAADGTVTYAVGGQSFTAEGGAMAGYAVALEGQLQIRIELDALAVQLITDSNNVQANGVASDGSPGQALFSGSAASDIAVALGSAAGLATAPAGSPAGSRNTANLGDLIATLREGTGPIARTDEILLGLSSRIAGLNTRREGLAIVAGGAAAALAARTGVDLDAEAANLVRLQQAFEANGRVMQVATELFDTILALR